MRLHCKLVTRSFCYKNVKIDVTRTYLNGEDIIEMSYEKELLKTYHTEFQVEKVIKKIIC